MNKTSILFVTAIFFLAACQKEIKRQDGGLWINRPPVVNAGEDTSIVLPVNTVRLNGTASYDNENNMRYYKWEKLSGPPACVISKPDSIITEVSGLVKGVYEFRLTIEDAGGLKNSDICVVFVQDSFPGPSRYFWVSINPFDTILHLPANYTVAQATTWSINNQPMQPATASIEWIKVAGPGSYLVNPLNALSVTLGDLEDGLYAFQCKVTDSLGWSNSTATVINVTDTTQPGTELTIADQEWHGTMGAEIFIQCGLDPYLPAGKSIKKVFLREDCDPVYARVPHIWDATVNDRYFYQLGYNSNGFYMLIYTLPQSCSFNAGNRPDVKIIY